MLTDELRERISKLSHVKRQLLNQQLRRQRTAAAVILPGSGNGSATAGACLSHTQQLIWRTQAANPAATFYNFPQVLRLDGQLDISALANALRFIVGRHDVLRTRFALAGDIPYAVIGGSPAADLRLGELPATAAAGSELDDLLYQHAQRPFDLSADPPLSAQLVRVAPDRHVLSLVHHFAAFDYWSLALFNRELSHCYNAYVAGSTPALPALPFTYADYAAWQHAPANEERLAAAGHYWRWQLSKHAHTTARLDHQVRGPLATFAADSFEFCLPAAMLARLERLAQHENATLFMLLLASLQTLLSRYTERPQVAVGALVANRPSPESELLLGNFSNRLLLWGNLAGNPTFRQHLHRVRGVTLDAYARQDVPLDRVAADLCRDRNPECFAGGSDQGNLIPIMFDYVNEPLAMPHLHGLAVTRLPIQGLESEYPLHVTAQRSQGYGSSHDHLRVRLQVRPDFEVRTSVPHIAYHWNTLLSAIAEDPEQRVEALPLTRNQPRRLGAGGWLAPASPLSSSPAARL